MIRDAKHLPLVISIRRFTAQLWEKYDRDVRSLLPHLNC